MRPRFHTKAPMLFLGLSLAGFVAACTVASADENDSALVGIAVEHRFSGREYAFEKTWMQLG